MNTKIALTTLILLLIPLSAALQITQPTGEITTQELPTEIVAQWTANSTNFTVELYQENTLLENITTQQTQQAFSLQEGNYYLQVHANNQSAQTNFSIVEETTPLQIQITTDKQEYELGEDVWFTITTNKPVTTQIDIVRAGEIQESYPFTVSDEIILMHPDITPQGEYQAILTTTNANAQVSFTVTKTPDLQAEFTHTQAFVNKRVEFEAQASGGQAPYEYQWVFSDQTTSDGKQTDHFFFEEGEYETTLIVTDAQGKQTSTSKTLNVQTQQYRAEITVVDQDTQIVAGADINLIGDENTYQQTTPQSGTATFENLQAQTYQVLITTNQTTHINTTLQISQDTTQVYTITRNESTPATNTTNTTQNNTTTQTTQTTQNEQQELLAAQQQELQQEQERLAAQQELREQKQLAKEEVQDTKFSLRLDSTTDAVLTYLDLYKEFDQAVKQIDQATNKQEIQEIQNSLITDVQITNERREVIYPDIEQTTQELQTYFQAQNIEDEKQQQAIQYNIQRIQANTSITQRSYQAQITYPKQTKTYTFTHKKITAPKQTQFIEIFNQPPKITATQSYEELAENTLAFSNNEYVYYSTTTQPATTLIIPEELIEPPLFSGLISFDIGASNTARSIVYVFILAMAVAGVYAGKKIHTRNNPSNIDAFCELTSHALDQIHNGDAHAIVELTPEIQQLHETLPKHEQQETQELIEHLNQETHKYHFNQASKHIYSIGEHADINMLSSAYEDVLHAYQQLNQENKQQLASHIQQLEQYLDEHITQ